jgi:hypothetical protein
MNKNFSNPEINKICTSDFEHVFAGKSGVNSNNGRWGSGNSNSNNHGNGHGTWQGNRGKGKN